jgi:hypothetical protein
MDFKNLKKKIREPSLETFAKCLCFPKRKPFPGYGLKNQTKIYSLSHGFLFFVISISAEWKSHTAHGILTMVGN